MVHASGGALEISAFGVFKRRNDDGSKKGSVLRGAIFMKGGGERIACMKLGARVR